MNISLPLYQVWDIGCVWLTINKGVKICNNWVYFESKFCDTFGSHYNYSCILQKYRRRLLLATCIPVTIVLGLFFVDYFSFPINKTDTDIIEGLNHPQNSSVIEMIRTNPEESRSRWSWISISNEFYFLPVPFFVFTTVLEEVKVILSLNVYDK